MYTLNTLMRPVLITPEEVIYHAPTKHSLDPRTISQSIIIAEERFIRSELGSNLYDAMVLAKNQEVTLANKVALQALIGANTPIVEGDVVNSYSFMSPAYQDLWKQYLWKLTAECTVATAFPEGFIQFSSNGVFHTVPPAGLMVTSGEVTPLLPSVKWALDKKIQDRIAPLIQSLHNYLCKNKTNYILYTKTCPDCDNDKQEKWSGLAQDLYNDDEPTRCCYND